jgi:hypothetical protein
MPLRNPLELFDRNSGAKFLMSAPKPKQREVRSGSISTELGGSRHVRFPTDSDRIADIPDWQLRATSRHQPSALQLNAVSVP